MLNPTVLGIGKVIEVLQSHNIAVVAYKLTPEESAFFLETRDIRLLTNIKNNLIDISNNGDSELSHVLLTDGSEWLLFHEEKVLKNKNLSFFIATCSKNKKIKELQKTWTSLYALRYRWNMSKSMRCCADVLLSNMTVNYL